MLCILCQNFFNNHPRIWDDPYDDEEEPLLSSFSQSSEQRAVNEGQCLSHQITINGPTSAIETSCHFCTLVRARIRTFLSGSSDPNLREIVSHDKHDAFQKGKTQEVRTSVVHLRQYDAWYRTTCVRIDFVVDTGPTIPPMFLPVVTSKTASLAGIGKSLELSTCSERSFELAKRWLKSCVDGHQACTAHTEFSEVLPARLIDVGDCNGSNPPRLHLTSSEYGLYEYFTLSHCWGNSPRLVLTADIVVDACSALDVSTLAQTFVDAIDITRRLGVRYLWIDCLCILQDSPEDWSRESAKMAGIYGKGVCNIAAAASSDSNGGCFMSRNPLEVQPLRFDNEGSILGPVYIFPKGLESTWDGARGTLWNRGWILQEFTLAPRTLHYGSQQVFWECRTSKACEVWPNGDQTNRQIWDRETDLGTNPKTLFNMEDADGKDSNSLDGPVKDYAEPNDLYQRWEWMIEDYSKRLLTYGRDKLTAMSGIADMMMSRTQDRYLSGLWESDLLRGLRWRTRTLVQRPREYRAPSWSWASIDGEIQHSPRAADTWTALAVLSEQELVLKGQHQNALIKSVRLTVTGLLREGRLIISGQNTVLKWLPLPTHHPYRSIAIFLDTTFDNIEQQVHCLQLYHHTQLIRGEVLFGLLLVPTECVEAEYRRVGSFEARQHDGSSELRFDNTTNSRFDQGTMAGKAMWEDFVEGWVKKEITII